MAKCLNSAHGASDYVFQAGRRRYSIFMAAQGAGYDWTKYSDSDLRMVIPGTKASQTNSQTFALEAIANSEKDSNNSVLLI